MFSLFSPHRPSNRGRILERNGDKSLKSFPPRYSQSPLQTNSPPPPLRGLKLVCNVNIVHRNFKSDTLKIMPRNLNKIVRLWIQLLDRQTCWVACLCVSGSELLTTKMREILVSFTQEHSTLTYWTEKKTKLQFNEIYCNIYKIIIYRVGGSKGLWGGGPTLEQVSQKRDRIVIKSWGGGGGGEGTGFDPHIRRSLSKTALTSA